MASTFVKQRLNAETGVMEAIQIPDHIDILAKMACGAQLNMTISNVTVGENFFELQGTEGVLKVSLGDGTLTLNGEEVEVPADEEGAWRVEEEFISAIRAPKIPRLCASLHCAVRDSHGGAVAGGHEQITHTNFTDGVKYMQFTEAVRSSWQRGVAVPVPLTRAAL